MNHDPISNDRKIVLPFVGFVVVVFSRRFS